MPVDDGIGGEAGLEAGSGASGDGAALGIVERPVDRRREPGDIVDGDQGVGVVADRLAHHRDVRGDDRALERHRLEHGAGEPLDP